MCRAKLGAEKVTNSNSELGSRFYQTARDHAARAKNGENDSVRGNHDDDDEDGD